MGAEGRLKVLQRGQTGLGVGRGVIYHELIEVPHRDFLALFAVVLAVQRDIERNNLDVQLRRRFRGQITGTVGNDIKHM